MFIPVDPVVLESIAFFRSSWPCQVPPVCHGYFQGAPARFCCPWRHEWHSEVSDPSRWQVHRPPAFSSHMVRGRVCSPFQHLDWICIFATSRPYPWSGAQIWPRVPWTWGNSQFGGFCGEDDIWDEKLAQTHSGAGVTLQVNTAMWEQGVFQGST